MNKKLKIAIIGYGRFGELYEKILKPFGEVLVVSGRNIKGVKQIDYGGLKNVDIVIPSVPISKFKTVIKKISTNLKKGGIVMDVCSVKVHPVKMMKKYLPKDVEIIATHPMFGPDSAKKSTKGLQVVYWPTRITDKNLKIILNIFKKLNLKIIKASPVEHDKQSAACLALVHFIGRGLSDIKIGKQAISTLGFERLLSVNETVNNDTWELFLDMNKYNPYTNKIRKNYIEALQNINKKLIKE